MVAKQKVYLLVGSPGSGKSWVSSRLGHKFKVLEHDDFKTTPAAYIPALKRAMITSDKPILANTPFGVSDIMEALGPECLPVFIIEPEETLKQRYFTRQGYEIPKGHLTRQTTYVHRANELKAFKGTSQEVLNYLIGR